MPASVEVVVLDPVEFARLHLEIAAAVLAEIEEELWCDFRPELSTWMSGRPWWAVDG